MIIVKNRELLIPNNERYIGTTYDTETENRVFQVPRFSQRGVDLAALTFRLDIQYANESYDTVILDKEVGEAYIILIWKITSATLQVPGTLYIGIRAVDSEVTVKWSSFSAAMYAERHLNTPGNYGGSLTEIEQMEQDHVYMKGVVDELKSHLDYTHEAEAWAIGKKDGEDVPSTDETYHNNSKYYSNQASTKATQAANSATAAANSATQAAETVSDTNTRFNNALAAVTSETEVIDARVGADGTTYPVLKTRLDTEHTQLKNAIDDAYNSAKADIAGGDATYFKWQDGFYYNHRESTNSTFTRSALISLNAGETISFTGGKGSTALPVNAITRLTDGTRSALMYYSGTTAESITFTPTVDMDVYVCSLKTLYGDDLTVVRDGILVDITTRLSAVENEYDALPDYIKNDVEPTSLSKDSSGAVEYSFTAGTTYLVKNLGTSVLSLSTRVTPSSVSTDAFTVGAGVTKRFKASGDANYLVCASAFSVEISTKQTLLPFIETTISKFGNYGTALPLVRFDFNRTMGDYADELNGLDFMANNGRWYSIMEMVYAKFDSLVSAYPDYVTKVDAAEDVNLTYPAYANLDGEASGNYSATPTYKTYMYKLVDTNSYVYSSRNPRKKLFLIGATHGNETAGAFNLYLLAKNLCEATNSDYFKLRESFEVYVLPCLNGYGMCHYVRWNADGVDINRNYPISNWTERGEPYVIGYTGPSAGSEFETRLVMALQDKYAFDVAVDHHNYGASNSQFYTEFWYERFNMLANASLADCSSVFIENLPAYFGTNYRLFVDINNSTRPNVVLSDTMPCMAKWMYEQGINFAATIEVGNQINYINGELNSATDIPKYTNDVFKVGEFTLRNQLLYYCGFVLGGMV